VLMPRKKLLTRCAASLMQSSQSTILLVRNDPYVYYDAIARDPA
jgi:hypothetical protein